MSGSLIELNAPRHERGQSATQLDYLDRARPLEQAEPGISTEELVSSFDAALGETHADWANPVLRAAWPVFRLVRAARLGEQTVDLAFMLQMRREVEQMRASLFNGDLAGDQAECASYIVCSTIDESIALTQAVNDSRDSIGSSFLVHFHGDSWGGDEVFRYYQHYKLNPAEHTDLLSLFQWCFAYGFLGKYRIIENGELQHALLCKELSTTLRVNENASLARFVTDPHERGKARWIGPLITALCVLSLLGLYLGGVFLLENQKRDLQAAIAAYKPPELQMRIHDLLPPPLPRLIAEGWVDAQRVERGWKLVLQTDQAFASGSAEVNPGFHRHLDELSQALGPWPGDLLIVGHTDDRPIRGGRYRDNAQLSLARARSVEGVLLDGFERMRERGVVTSDRAIAIEGLGEAEPVASNSSTAGRSRNRRVEIFWRTAQDE